MTTSPRRWEIFLCHANLDVRFADRLHDLLRSKLSVFLASKSIKPGAEWNAEIKAAQTVVHTTVVLISSNTPTAPHQQEEIGRAISRREQQGGQHRIIPVYLPGIGPDSREVPPALQALHAVTLRSDEDLPAVATKLYKLLKPKGNQPPRDMVGKYLVAGALPIEAALVFVAVVVVFLAMRDRYRAEVRHNVESISAQIREVLSHPVVGATPEQIEKNTDELVLGVVTSARWDNGNGYFFLYDRETCLANGGFPELVGVDFRTLGEPKHSIIERLWSTARQPEIDERFQRYRWGKPKPPEGAFSRWVDGILEKRLGLSGYMKLGYAMTLDLPGSREGWWVGSGAYLDDFLWTSIGVSFLIILPVSGLGLIIWLLRRLDSNNFEQQPQAMLITNRHNVILKANHEACVLFDASAAELAGTHVAETIPKANWEEYLELMRYVDRGEVMTLSDVLRQRLDGSELRVNIKYVPVKLLWRVVQRQHIISEAP